jgi:hypothetical protein
VDWSELERLQPGLAALGRRRLLEPGVVLVATIRGDGTPRISPVEPFVLEGVLWLSMLWQSRKAADLLRDPRILVQSVITSRDGGEGEFKIRGTARAEHDPELWRRYAGAVAASLGWSPEPGRFHLFAVGVEEVTLSVTTTPPAISTSPGGRRRAGSSAGAPPPPVWGDPAPAGDIIVNESQPGP